MVIKALNINQAVQKNAHSPRMQMLALNEEL